MTFSLPMTICISGDGLKADKINIITIKDSSTKLSFTIYFSVPSAVKYNLPLIGGRFSEANFLRFLDLC